LGLQNNDSRKEHDASQLAATSASKSEVWYLQSFLVARRWNLLSIQCPIFFSLLR
jgi:hypothetical protein